MIKPALLELFQLTSQLETFSVTYKNESYSLDNLCYTPIPGKFSFLHLTPSFIFKQTTNFCYLIRKGMFN